MLRKLIFFQVSQKGVWVMMGISLLRNLALFEQASRLWSYFGHTARIDWLIELFCAPHPHVLLCREGVAEYFLAPNSATE